MISPLARWSILLPCLAGAAWLVATADAPPTAESLSLPVRTVQTHARQAVGRALADASPLVASDALVPRALLSPCAPDHATARDPFSPRSWTRPAVAVSAAPERTLGAAACAVHRAGQEAGGRGLGSFLGRGERTLLARRGDVLEGTYRVDSIEPPFLTLTHLPLGQAQQVPIGRCLVNRRCCLLRCLALPLLTALFAGCTAQRAFQDGEVLLTQGRSAEALLKLRKTPPPGARRGGLPCRRREDAGAFRGVPGRRRRGAAHRGPAGRRGTGFRQALPLAGQRRARARRAASGGPRPAARALAPGS